MRKYSTEIKRQLGQARFFQPETSSYQLVSNQSRGQSAGFPITHLPNYPFTQFLKNYPITKLPTYPIISEAFSPAPACRWSRFVFAPVGVGSRSRDLLERW